MKGLTIPLVIDVDIQDQDWFLTPEELSKRFGDPIFSQLQGCWFHSAGGIIQNSGEMGQSNPKSTERARTPR